MATSPPLIGRTVEHLINGQWVKVLVTEHNGGSIAVVPLDDQRTRIVATFPLNSAEWRL